MLASIAASFLILELLVLVYELGRLLAAKAVAIDVLRFAVGFGPPTPLRFKHRETVYVLCWLPLGGSIEVADAEDKPVSARMLVTAAGVLTSLLLAWLTYSAVAFYGRTEESTTTLWRVDAAKLPEAAAALAKAPTATRILRVNGEDVETWNAILAAVMDPRSDQLRFDFAAADPIVVTVPGTDARARAAIAGALVPFREARISFLAPGRPAMEAGLLPGDVIVAIDGEPVGAWDDLVRAVEVSAGEALVLSLRRGGELLEIPMVPREETVWDPLSGEPRTVGRIGVGPLIDTVRIRPGFWQAWDDGAQRTWESSSRLVSFLRTLFTGDVQPVALAGPIAIAQTVSQGSSELVALLNIIAFLSVNIAILNLLPIPPLAGAGLCFLLLEAMLGKPLPSKLRRRIDQVGKLIIGGLIVLGILSRLSL